MAKILIVDDESLFLDIYEDILNGAGHNATGVLSGELALKCVQTDQPDLILLDILMPDMSGLEVIRHLRADPSVSNMPILAITSLKGTSLYDEIYEAGGNGYISKAVNAKQLINRVNEMLAW